MSPVPTVRAQHSKGGGFLPGNLSLVGFPEEAAHGWGCCMVSAVCTCHVTMPVCAGPADSFMVTAVGPPYRTRTVSVGEGGDLATVKCTLLHSHQFTPFPQHEGSWGHSNNHSKLSSQGIPKSHNLPLHFQF